MSIYTPLKMVPCFKSYLWGGGKLKKEFGKVDAPEVTAESWELSCHPDGQSRIADGLFSGMTVEQLGLYDRVGFWGIDCPEGGFPLLVKLIDAKRDLSIQVHPSDETAVEELGEQGKAEMWYVVDCEPQSYIYFGFSRQMTREEFLARARDGSICEVLNRVPVSPGDVFYILPGTIHAICAGIVIAEIQQNSNTTFRVYDYQRRGPDGKPRQLHLDRAAEVVNYRPIVPEECQANSSVSFPAFTMSEMFSCPYFRAYCVKIRNTITLRCDEKSFQHLLCVSGTGELINGESTLPIRRGDSYFLPARLGAYTIRGRCKILLSRI